MIDIYQEFRQLVSLLEQAKLPYAICGGFAVAIHGYVRATKDIDLLVQEVNLEAIVDVAKQGGFDPSDGFLTFGIGTENQTVIKRLNKFVGTNFLSLDLILVSNKTAGAWRDRLVVKFQDQEITVVSRKGLITMKEIAGRQQDLLDIAKLQERQEK